MFVAGPSFPAELKAAGLGDLPICWGDDGQISNPQLHSPETIAAFNAVVAAHDPRIPAIGGLFGYANEAQWALATGGFSAEVDGSQVRFQTDADSVKAMTAKAVRLQLPGAPATVRWQIGEDFVTIGRDAFVQITTRIDDFVQSTFDRLSEIRKDIEAGRITTTAQVDAALAAP